MQKVNYFNNFFLFVVFYLKKERKFTIFMNVMTSCFPEYNSTLRVKEINLFIIKKRLLYIYYKFVLILFYLKKKKHNYFFNYTLI